MADYVGSTEGREMSEIKVMEEVVRCVEVQRWWMTLVECECCRGESIPMAVGRANEALGTMRRIAPSAFMMKIENAHD
jgi:hypothetical protein